MNVLPPGRAAAGGGMVPQPPNEGHTIPTISVQDLKAQLSSAIARAEAGETLAITRHNKTVAHLAPDRLAPTHRGSRVGTGRLRPAIKGGLKGAKGRYLAVLADDRGER